jgi:hypothetical protein
LKVLPPTGGVCWLGHVEHAAAQQFLQAKVLRTAANKASRIQLCFMTKPSIHGPNAQTFV